MTCQSVIHTLHSNPRLQRPNGSRDQPFFYYDSRIITLHDNFRLACFDPFPVFIRYPFGAGRTFDANELESFWKINKCPLEKMIFLQRTPTMKTDPTTTTVMIRMTIQHSTTISMTYLHQQYPRVNYLI